MQYSNLELNPTLNSTSLPILNVKQINTVLKPTAQRFDCSMVIFNQAPAVSLNNVQSP